MKRMLIFVCLLAMTYCVNAQSVVKPEKYYRYVYLWDVTLSMKGYNGSPDIYDDVVDFLLEDIDGLPNGKNREVIDQKALHHDCGLSVENLFYSEFL